MVREIFFLYKSNMCETRGAVHVATNEVIVSVQGSVGFTSLGYFFFFFNAIVTINSYVT